MLTVGNQEKLFGQLLGRPENTCCADCGSKSPTWASIDFGVFVCLNCSGAHRALGPSITRVRSTKLDSWQSGWSDLLVLGNQQCNKYWEEQLVGAKKPTPSSSLDQIKRFVQDKYVKKRYASAGLPNPVVVLKGRIARGEDVTVDEAPVIKPQQPFKEVKKEVAAPVQEIKAAVNPLLTFQEEDDHQFSPFQGAPESAQPPVADNSNFDLINFDDHHTPNQHVPPPQKAQVLSFDAIAGHHYSQSSHPTAGQHQHPHPHILQHHNQPMHSMYTYQQQPMHVYGHYQQQIPGHHVYNPYHQHVHQQPFMYQMPAMDLHVQSPYQQHSNIDLQF